jgi:putative redox protein
VRQSYRVQFPGGSGFPLAGIVDRPSDAAVAPVAVFSHCFTCNKDLKAIVRISRALAVAGIAVLRFDMTGLGGSEGDFSQTNFSSNLADLAAAIQFATAQLGPVQAIIGHSFGGAAALATAGRGTAPDLRSLITIAAPSDTLHLADLLQRLDATIAASGKGTVTIGGIHWTITRQMLEDFRSHDLPRMISAVQVPTLLFHSPQDRTLSFDHAVRIMGLIQNSPAGPPPASLLVLHGADHLLATDQADIDLVTTTAAAWIRRWSLV